MSIIIPMCNAASTIGMTLGSALEQTMRNMEVIVVDDGSTDGCGEIVAAMAAHDPRVRLMYQKNSGVSAARNAGLSMARGEWVFFLDADDEIMPDALAILLRESEGAEIVTGAFGDDEAELECSGTSKTLTSDVALRLCLAFWDNFALVPFPVFSRGVTFRSVSPKLIRRDLISRVGYGFSRGIRFGEDALFMARLYLNVRTVVVVDRVVYRYVDNPKSVTRNFRSENVKAVGMFLDALEMFTGEYPKCTVYARQSAVREVLTVTASCRSLPVSEAESILARLVGRSSFQRMTCKWFGHRYSASRVGDVKNYVTIALLRLGLVGTAVVLNRAAYRKAQSYA